VPTKSPELTFFADTRLIKYLSGTLVAVLSLYLIVVLVVDASRSVPYPLPHDYGEGILGWMTQEISAGRSPYGDITAVPSRYAAYGPLTAWVASGLAQFLGDDNMRYLWSGRILNSIYWLIAGAILGLLCRPKLAAIAIAPVLALAISHSSFMFSFRVDSMMIMLEAAILYVLVKQNPRQLAIGLPLLVTALTMVKPPAALDLFALGILALALSPKTWKTFLRDTWKPGLVAILSAPTVFFLLDQMLYGGWMSHNILTIQRISGWAEPYSPDMMIGTFFMMSSLWPLLVWSLWGPAAQSQPKARLAFIALSLGFMLNGALALKYGAVTNYYFPLLVLMMGSASMLLRNNAQLLVFLGAVAIAALPLTRQGGAFRGPGKDYGKTAELSNRVTAVHQTDNIITEDVFFSVRAGQQALISDIFQYNLVAAQKKIPNRKMLEAAEVLWGDFRVKHLLGKKDNEKVEFVPSTYVPTFHPAPPYLRGMTFPTSKLEKSVFLRPPLNPDYPLPLKGYLRNCAIPGILLILVALFWDSKYNRQEKI
jgi:hypothetical protein